MTAPAALPPSAVRRPRRLTRFVVQEHHARSHHFDLRIEKDGVLKSWALPKGPLLAPGEKHLAVEVPDHPPDYAEFEGDIPAGEPGAGTVRRWDEGTCEIREWGARRIIVVLRGARLHGCYALVRAPRIGAHHWLFLSLLRPRRAGAAAAARPGRWEGFSPS